MKRSASGAAAVLIMCIGMTGLAGAQDSTTTTSTMATTTTTETLPAESVQDCVDPANPQGGFVPCENLTTTTTAMTTEGSPVPESVQDCVDPANPQGGFVPCETLTTTTTVERSAESTSTTRRDGGVAGTTRELPRTGVGSVLLAGLGVLVVAAGALLTRASHREVPADRR